MTNWYGKITYFATNYKKYPNSITKTIILINNILMIISNILFYYKNIYIITLIIL